MQISLTGSGILVWVLGMLLAHFGINYDATQLSDVAGALVTVIGFVMTLIGQARRPEVSGFIFKK